MSKPITTSSEEFIFIAERGVEANEPELGEIVAWCIELERVMVLVARTLYQRST